MKVLLVNSATPAYKEFYTKVSNVPSGIFCIAAVLEKNGHSVQIFDNFIDHRKPEDFISFNPDVIGFSALAGPNIEGSISQSREFKNIFPEAKIVWGNVLPSVLPDKVISEPYVDFVVVGAGEYTLLELANNLEKGEPKLEEIKGLVFKHDGKLIFNEPRPFIKNLEELPDPAWHLVDVKKYTSLGLNTSRGCIHRCTFCYNKSYNKGYIGYLSAQRIVSQIEHLQEKYNTRFIKFNEDNFTFNRKRLREFCNTIIDRRIKIKWYCDSRADINENDIKLMARAGCIEIGLGVESGSQRMLDFVQKDIKIEQVEKTFWLLIKHKIRTTIYLMYGFPEETTEDFYLTHDLLRRLDHPYYMYNQFVPFPGSALYDYCLKQGTISPVSTISDWTNNMSGLYRNQINLSLIPQNLIDEAVLNFRQTYALERFRFTLKHDPSYFLIIFTNPIKFLHELYKLIQTQTVLVKFNKRCKRLLLESHPCNI
ncbi:radical SAM domain protein [Dehalogenimonas sp. WBC-2]|nr:radical SAM domain protein [Dehalogenimonas sp. WBC-2]